MKTSREQILLLRAAVKQAQRRIEHYRMKRKQYGQVSPPEDEADLKAENLCYAALRESERL